MYGFTKLLQSTSTLQPKKWSRKMFQQLKCYKHEETRVWIPRHINYMCGSPSLIQSSLRASWLLTRLVILASSGFNWETLLQQIRYKRNEGWFYTSISGLDMYAHIQVHMPTTYKPHTHIHTHENLAAGDWCLGPLWAPILTCICPHANTYLHIIKKNALKTQELLDIMIKV